MLCSLEDQDENVVNPGDTTAGEVFTRVASGEAGCK
jgi:hypothetical protein